MNNLVHIIPEWLELVFLVFCTGAIACRLWVLKSGLPGVWRLFCICLAALTVSAIINLMSRSMEMSGQPFPAVINVLPTVIFHTHLGHAWLIRFAAIVLLAVLVALGARYRDSQKFLFLMLFLLVIISMTESAMGHSADKGDFSLPEISDLLHLLAASVWGGGLFLLSIAILPRLVKPGNTDASTLAGIAGRFSMIAGVAVGVMAVTASYNAWIEVGSLEGLLKTTYGLTATTKIFLFLLLVTIGAFNRYVNVPSLREWAGDIPGHRGIVGGMAARLGAHFIRNRDGYEAALRFKRYVSVEASLIIGVLLCSAMLRHEIPARHQLHMNHHMNMSGRQACFVSSNEWQSKLCPEPKSPQ